MVDEGSAPIGDAADPATESAPPAAEPAPVESVPAAETAPVAEAPVAPVPVPEPPPIPPEPEAASLAPAEPAQENIEVTPLSPDEAVPEELPTPAKEPVAQVEPVKDTPPAPKAPAASSPVQTSAPTEAPIKTYRPLALKARRAEKERHLAAIVELARTHGEIRNDDVQIRCLISDSTATRYLNELVLAGRLFREGARRSARYRLP